jgi:RTX calcium-binding nonapeptide repeat (4 copies)
MTGVWGLALALLVAAGPAQASVNSAMLVQDGQRDAPWTAAAGATYWIDGDSREVRVYVIDPDDRDYSFWFAAPPPALLTTGVYDRAMRATPVRGRPGIYVSRPYASCNTYDGRFEIKDFALGPDGVPVRLWVVFEYRCDHYKPEFGEIRYGMPSEGPVVSVPSVLRWGAHVFGTPRVPVAVTLRASAPTQLAQARIDGMHAGEFAIEDDACSGRTLATGESCVVHVRFVPQGPGARFALLDMGAVQTQLQGFSHGGLTRLEIEGATRRHVFTPADSWFEVTGNANSTGFYVAGQGTGAVGRFEAPFTDPLAPGRYTGSRGNTTEPMPQPYPRSVVQWPECSGSGGEFTITDVSQYPDGAARSLGVEFVQPCSPDNAIRELRGSFAYRVGDTTTPAPWMSGGAPEPAGTGSGAQRLASGWTPASQRCSGTPLLGSPRSNRLRGTRGGDRIVARGGNDRILGGRGDDCLHGGAGRDRVDGGPGADLVRGGPGRDVLVGGPGRDRLDCGAGRDLARVGPGDRTRGCERVRSG